MFFDQKFILKWAKFFTHSETILNCKKNFKRQLCYGSWSLAFIGSICAQEIISDGVSVAKFDSVRGAETDSTREVAISLVTRGPKFAPAKTDALVEKLPVTAPALRPALLASTTSYLDLAALQQALGTTITSSKRSPAASASPQTPCADRTGLPPRHPGKARLVRVKS